MDRLEQAQFARHLFENIKDGRDIAKLPPEARAFRAMLLERTY